MLIQKAKTQECELGGRKKEGKEVEESSAKLGDD